MENSTQNEWQRMIDRYSAELLSQYNAASHSLSSAPPAVEAVEAITEKPTKDLNALSDIGTLQVRVSTEDQAVPIPGAVVTVRHDFGDGITLDRILTTNDSGLTSLIDLPTKDRALSLSPGNSSPFTEYTVEVTADGYYTKIFENIPIYGGVTAVQSVSMIPLPEFSESDMPIVYNESEKPTL